MAARDEARKSTKRGSAEGGERGTAEPGKRTLDTTEGGAQRARSGTAGTDGDFDESGESANQGHGHPRQERETER